MTGLNRRSFARLAVFPAIGDILLFSAALTLSCWLRGPHPTTKTVFIAYAPLFGLWMAGFYALGLYEIKVTRDFVSLIGGLFASTLVCVVLGTTYFYLSEPYLGQTPKTHLVIVIAASHLGVFSWRRLWLWALDIHLLSQNLVFLGDAEQVREIEANLVAGAQQGGYASLKWQWPGVDMVVADLEWVEEHWDEARTVLSEAVKHRVPVVSLDAFYESLTGKVSPDWASRPSWAIEHVLPRAGSSYALMKRLGDALAAALLLVALSPLLETLYILIAFFDKTSPLYGQRRIGLLGREFTLWKFRTMRPGADSHGPFRADRESPERVTRLGAFLRRYRLDELPQLWNVLIGDMSLVGPRPEWVKEVEVLEKVVPNYHLRHLAPPGITGWAQVYYRATNGPQESVEKHHYDLYYLKHFSFALDVSILLKTLKRVCVGDARVAAERTPFPRVAPRTSALRLDVSSIINRN
jgi:lipopolysaccharide/colanic/teichoic acid biosynthesis glycosyltransferase